MVTAKKSTQDREKKDGKSAWKLGAEKSETFLSYSFSCNLIRNRVQFAASPMRATDVSSRPSSWGKDRDHQIIRFKQQIRDVHMVADSEKEDPKKILTQAVTRF